MKFIFVDGYRIIVKKKITDTISIFVQFSVSPCEFISLSNRDFFCFKLEAKYHFAAIYLWNIYFFASLGKQLRPTVGLVERLAAPAPLRKACVNKT